MSRETMTWLNTMTKHGFAPLRGKPWHRDEEIIALHGENLWDGPVPPEEVISLLDSVKPRSVPFNIREDDGTEWSDPSRQVIVSEGFNTVLGTFKKGYRIHDFTEWGYRRMEEVMLSSGGTLQVGSVGLLKGGAVAYVQAQMPETVKGPGGVEFWPFINFSTSLDGSISSQYWAGAQMIVCDNTLSAGLAEGVKRAKYRHTKNSLDNVDDVIDQLGLLSNVEAAFSAQLETLTNVDVTESEWNGFVNLYKPIPADKGAGQTRARNVHNVLNDLYFTDLRVAPFAGSAFGVIQAVNTYVQHEQTFKSSLNTRRERNALAVVEGDVDTMDRQSLTLLNRVFEIGGRELISL